LFCESNTVSNYNAEEEVVTLSLLDASTEPFESLICESNTVSNYNAKEEVVTLSLSDASAEPFESLNCSMSSKINNIIFTFNIILSTYS